MITRIQTISNRLGNLRASSFIKNAGMLAGSTALRQLIVFVASIALSRIYAPAEYAILTIFVSLSGPLTLMVTGQFDQAIPLEETDESRARLMEFTLLLTVVSSLIIGGFATLYSREVSALLRLPELAPYLPLLPFSLIGGGFFATFNMWNVQRKAFKTVAASTMRQTLSRVISQGVLGILGFRPIGLLLGETIGAFGGVGVQFWSIWKFDKPLFLGESLSRSSWRTIPRKHIRFPVFAMPSAVLHVMANSVAQIFLASMFGTVIGGLFGMSQRLIAMPVALIGYSLGQVFYADLVTQRDNINHHRMRFWQVSVILGAAGVAGGVMLLLAPYWAGGLLGSKWAQAGWVIASMAPMLIGQIVIAPVARVYFVYGKQYLLFCLDLFRLFLILFLFGVASRLSWLPETVLWSFSTCMFFVYVIHWVCISWILNAQVRNTGDSIRPPAA